MAKMIIKQLKSPKTGSMAWFNKYNRTIIWGKDEIIDPQWIQLGWNSSIKTLKDGTRKMSKTVSSSYEQAYNNGIAIIKNSGCILEAAE